MEIDGKMMERCWKHDALNHGNHGLEWITLVSVYTLFWKKTPFADHAPRV
jgi:hypothetical protein